MSDFITVTVEQDVDISLADIIDGLDEDELQSLAFRALDEAPPAMLPALEKIWFAIELKDGKALHDLLHRLCMDHLGRPVLNKIEIHDWKEKAA